MQIQKTQKNKEHKLKNAIEHNNNTCIRIQNTNQALNEIARKRKARAGRSALEMEMGVGTIRK